LEKEIYDMVFCGAEGFQYGRVTSRACRAVDPLAATVSYDL
jgi:hypothetical protein